MFMFTSKKHVIFIFLVLGGIVFTLLPIAYCKICDSIDVRNRINQLEKLRNCTEITGNLYIVLIDTTNSVSDYDDYQFPELTRVSGYVLFFKLKHLPSIGKLFPNLRLIGGLELFFDFSLILYNLPNLREIGTDKLLYIAKGYVKIDKTPQLCYANTIKWNAIGNSTALDYRPTKEDCPLCPDRCNGYCWNQEKCQIFQDNCHEECLGCRKDHSNTDCEVCKNYEDDGVCVAKCPTNKYILRTMNKCITKEKCYQLNHNEAFKIYPDSVWITYENECRNDCPIGTEYHSDLTTCISCGSKCIRNCTVKSELNNQNAIVSLKGCTHIYGFLSIVGMRTEQDLEALRDSLGSVRVITGFLQISRNKVIRDLDFLPSLVEIGSPDWMNNMTLMVFENQNLRKLWKGNSTIKINGRIGFNDNEQLCLSEIEQLAKRSKITYSDTDVSINSNGVYCLIPPERQMVINVTDASPHNVTLNWKIKDDTDVLYYAIYYTDLLNDSENDVCISNNWATMTTSRTTIQLLNLKAFTTYYYYIKVHRQNMHSESMKYNFTTLPDDPESPSHFTAQALDHQSVKLVWHEPVNTYGILSNYTITIYKEEDDPDLIRQRDYCLYPHNEKGSKVFTKDEENPYDFNGLETDNLQMNISSNSNYTWSKIISRKTCRPPIETDIVVSNNLWSKLCNENSPSKYNYGDCKNYYYDHQNIASIPVEKRSGIERTSSIKKKYSNHHGKEKNVVFTETADANQTSIIIKHLQQFTVYVFYLMACNKEVDERKLCSSVLQTSIRTLPNPNADSIPNDQISLTVKGYDVDVSWSEPKNPNSILVGYNIIYKRDLVNSKQITICISQQKFETKRKYILKDMLPGKYFLRIQPISLNGLGNSTKKTYFYVHDPNSSSHWLIVFACLIAVLSIIGVIIMILIRRKRAKDIHLIANVNPDYAGLIYVEDEWEMRRSDIDLLRPVGQGTFGVVHYGLIKSKNKHCAVKTVNENATIKERINFLAEASIMKKFSKAHHVVKLFGVVSRDQPPLVIMELMERGDLKMYLRRLRDSSSQNITSNEIYRMAIEIADGVSYLTSKKYVHRDLAARNCMVAHDKTVKIGDFGMTRDIYENDYYKRGTKGLLPVRWMAPESLADGVFTSDSDIWSYGIVLWEIATLAEQPYQGMTNEQVVQFIISQGSLQRPQECPNLLWEIMHRCWEWYPRDRPTCFEIVETLQEHVGKDFELVSYYHSREGKEFLYTQGPRANNPPALEHGLAAFDESDTEKDPLSSNQQEPDFLPPSSPHEEDSRLSGKFH